VCNIVKEEMIWEERCKKESNLQKKWYVYYIFSQYIINILPAGKIAEKAVGRNVFLTIMALY